LVLENPEHPGQQPSVRSPDFQVDFDSIRVDSLARAVDLLRTERFDAVYTDTSDQIKASGRLTYSRRSAFSELCPMAWPWWTPNCDPLGELGLR